MKAIFYTIDESGNVISEGSTEDDRMTVGSVVSNLAQAGIKRRKGNFGEGWVRLGKEDELHVWMYERADEDLDTTDDSTAEDRTTTEEPQ